MGLGLRVRERRVALGFSQERLASEAGVTWSAIQRLESGHSSDPHYSTLLGIAHALGTSVGELVGETEPAPLISPLSGVGAQETAELLDMLNSETYNLADPALLSSLEGASDAAIRRVEREVRQELALLVPELNRLGEELKPGDAGYMTYNKAYAWASQQVLVMTLFLRIRPEPEPEEELASFEDLAKKLVVSGRGR